ncbi:hypothetical protein HHK36_004237 [Tetracentron sinense]|uniref:Ribosome maturation factor RimP N-terminal domain-containing protein n=1 Tax=Tetracentron sinense TaxID=13715 RepID=A0A835DT03_TETSI|nr:hypothetical protein HHK36_004237 [Tetracentron sinense]
MEIPATWNFKASRVKDKPVIMNSSCFYRSLHPSSHNLSFPFRSYPLPYFPNKSCIIHAKKRDSQSGPVLKPTIIEEVALDEEEDGVVFDEFQDEALIDGDDYFEDEYEVEDSELCIGDGGGGGGISLAGTWWDKEALNVAEDVSSSLDGDFKIYAFKTSANLTIQVRIEKLSNKSGSPTVTDIGVFSSAYRARLDEAEHAGSIPENISLEVSSPGVERVVRIPQDLDRFKDRSMYVKYVSDVVAPGPSTESDGVFRLVSFNLETNCCTWGLANVKINREKAGKGRPLSKKQREWRLNTPFDSLRIVRLYSEC